MTDLDTTIRTLVADWEDFWPNRVIPNHCIFAVGVIDRVLRDNGHPPARIVACDVLAANAQAVGLIQREVPVASWPPGAWSVGAVHHPGYSGDDYNGHVVAIAGNWLIDLSIGQFARPDRNILIAGPTAVDISPDPEANVIEVDLPRRGSLGWTLRPDQTGWRQSPDWKQRRKSTRVFYDWRDNRDE